MLKWGGVKRRANFWDSHHRWTYIWIGIRTMTHPNKVWMLAHDVEAPMHRGTRKKIYHLLNKASIIEKD
jgi:hypothetical protein